MSIEQNKSLVRRYVEDVWGKGQTTLVAQLAASDICDHNPMPGQPRGMEGQRFAVDTFRRAIPDMRITVDLLVAEGDRVVDRWTCSGTQTGELFGLPPSGKRFTFTGTDMFRISNGKAAELWHMEDMLTMMQQLGAIPAASQAGTTTGRSSGAMAAPSNGAKTLSAEAKRALIRRAYLEFIDRSHPAAADELLTGDYKGHFSGAAPVSGREEFKQFISAYNTAMSDHHAEVADIVVEGDLAACRVTFTGKHTGRLKDIAPTGKQVRGTGLSVFRFSGDRVAEQWANSDDFGLLQQIGVIPEMAGAEVAVPC